MYKTANHFLNCEMVSTCKLLLLLSLREEVGRIGQGTKTRKPRVQLGLSSDGLPSKECYLGERVSDTQEQNL